MRSIFLYFFCSLQAFGLSNPFEIYSFKSENFKFEKLEKFELNSNEPKMMTLFKELQSIEEKSINPEKDEYKVFLKIEDFFLKLVFDKFSKNRKTYCQSFKDKYGGHGGCLKEFTREFLNSVPLKPASLKTFSTLLEKIQKEEQKVIGTRVRNSALMKIKSNNDTIGVELMIIKHLLPQFSELEEKALGQKKGKAYRSSMDLLQSLNYFIKKMPVLVKLVADTKFQMKKTGRITGATKEFMRREQGIFNNYHFQYQKLQKSGLNPTVIKAKTKKYMPLMKNIK